MKARPRPPDGLARDYSRAVRARIAAWHAELGPIVLSEYGGPRLDAVTRRGARAASRALDGLEAQVEAVGDRIYRRAAREQERILGVPTPKHVRNAVPLWREQNVGLIKSIPEDDLATVEEVLTVARREGWLVGELAAELEAQFGVSDSRAKLIARDQTLKLNAQITQSSQQSVGVESYTWSTSKDSRVRDTHKDLQGTIHKWTDPPIVDDKGRRAHPGEDYQCRCVAIPILPWET